MNRQVYTGPERRKFVRLDYVAPLGYKICKKETLDKILQGYTANISETGLLCNIKDPVKKNDILWLSFDRGALGLCENMERKALIYQNGVIGKVARVEHKRDNTYNVGVNFITKEEKNLTNIYPKIHFVKDGEILIVQPDTEEEKEEEVETERPESREELDQTNEEDIEKE